MKKTLGSAKIALVISFLTESILLAFISLLLAIAFVFFLLNATSFNQLIEKSLTLDFFSNPLLLFGSIAVTFLIGVLSGLYPALYLPSIPTLTALKGSFKNRKSSHVLRKVLITTQFAISIFVVVCTLFMQDQINYVRSHELGFDKDNVLILPIQDSLVRKQINAIRNEFLQNPNIIAATTSYEVMGKNANGGRSVMWAEGEDGMKQQSFTIISAGDDYLKTLGMKLITGRDFLPDTKRKGSREFVVNETAAKLMGWTQDPIGKKVKFFHDTEDGQVIGIVKDFNVTSLHNAVEPVLITKAWDDGGFLHLKIKGDLPNVVKYVKDKWKTFDPDHPFEYFFLDQTFNNQYKEDEMQYKLLSGLSYICIFISLLGLLGLSAFTAAQRTKEIGIRKVHGANVPAIIYLLYKDVMVLVIIASIVVVPLSYFGIQFWLDNFAYKVSLNYLLLAWVAVAALVFTYITVAFHSLKTARTNPVESLKYE
jgi:putative ABC transport system permease protein